ncbi:28720_t:CDS:1, partial [Gigaspora margarita]
KNLDFFLFTTTFAATSYFTKKPIKEFQFSIEPKLTIRLLV